MASTFLAFTGSSGANRAPVGADMTTSCRSALPARVASQTAEGPRFRRSWGATTSGEEAGAARVARLQVAGAREAVEVRPDLRSGQHHRVGDVVLERACVVEVAGIDGFEAGVADELLGDVACFRVGGEDIAGAVALGGDLVVDAGEVGVEALRRRAADD